MNMTKKYTFKDWLEETNFFYEVYVKQIDDTIELAITGNYPDILKRENRIDEDEYKKIENAQKEAYDIVINYHIEKTIQNLFEAISQAPDKKKYLQTKKKNLISKIESFPPEIIEDVYAGRWSKMRIDSVTYHKIMERHNNGLSPEPIQGISSKFISTFGLHPNEFNLKYATTEIDKHFSLTLMFNELLEIEKILDEEDDVDSQLPNKPKISNQDVLGSITTNGIYQKYHSFYDSGKGMKQKAAYEIIEDWLLNELNLTKEEVKEKWNVTLDVDTFTRSARNNRFK